MSLRERLTNIIKKIPAKIDTQQDQEASSVPEVSSQNLEKRTTKTLGPMITRVILGRYEIPSHNAEDDLK